MNSSSPPPAPHAVRVDRVRFGYPHGRSRTEARSRSLFEDLSLSVQSGEMLGVIGPNGSGKSTLLKLLAGILCASAGSIQIHGREAGSMSRTEFGGVIAYLPQEVVITFPFTVRDVVLMGRYPHRKSDWRSFWGWESEADYQIAAHAMADVNVLGFADALINEISAGERQRTLIARALAQEARIVLLDEPTAFLDLKHQVEICRHLCRLSRERGLTMIMVSHDLNLAGHYCDRLLLLNRGTVVDVAEPAAVLRSEVLESVYQCPVLVDVHPETGRPRVSLSGTMGRDLQSH